MSRYNQTPLSATRWDQDKISRYPKIPDIEGKLLKEWVVGTSYSLRCIHDIRDISVRDTKVQLYVESVSFNSYLTEESILPDSEQHHVCFVPVGQTGEEVLLPLGGDLYSVRDDAGCLLLSDGSDVTTWNGKLKIIEDFYQ